jgi:hypothetical protein
LLLLSVVQGIAACPSLVLELAHTLVQLTDEAIASKLHGALFKLMSKHARTPANHLTCSCVPFHQGIAGCHSLVLQLARSLLQLMSNLSQQLQQQHSKKSSRSSGSGGSSSSKLSPTSSLLSTRGLEAAAAAAASANANAATRGAVAVDPRHQQHSNARQLLQQLFLQGPASFVALDCLPQLCRALLGPSAAHALLHGPYAGSSSSSIEKQQPHHHQQQQQQLVPAAEVSECLSAVVGTARRLAAAVSPRWVGAWLMISCVYCRQIYYVLAQHGVMC